MKKLFSLIAMAVMCTCFVSCSDDDEISEPIVIPQVFSSVQATLSLHLTEATLNLGQVIVMYPNSKGEIGKESILKPDWEKTVTITKPISEYEFQVFIAKSPSMDISDSNPTFSTADDGSKYALLGLDKIVLSVTSFDQNGQELSYFKLVTKDDTKVKPNEINSFFEVISGKPYYSWAAVFDKDGKGSEKKP